MPAYATVSASSAGCSIAREHPHPPSCKGEDAMPHGMLICETTRHPKHTSPQEATGDEAATVFETYTTYA